MPPPGLGNRLNNPVAERSSGVGGLLLPSRLFGSEFSKSCQLNVLEMVAPTVSSWVAFCVALLASGTRKKVEKGMAKIRKVGMRNVLGSGAVNSFLILLRIGDCGLDGY